MAITKSSPCPVMHEQIQRYGIYVNENRAIPEAFDGQKPVHRRLLYAMYTLGLKPTGAEIKCARIVGDTVGKYHPHSDSAAYEALVTLINCSNPLAQGEGNFGSPVTEDREAAQRYTNAKFTALGYHTLFDPRLIAVTKMVPNYDQSTAEPFLLPARLPMLLLNGTEGIGVAMATKCASFSLASVIKTVVKYIDTPKPDYKVLLGLRLHYPQWGSEFDSSRQKKAWIQFLKTGKGRLEFDSAIDVDAKAKTIVLGPYAYGLKPFTNLLGSKTKPNTIRSQPWYRQHHMDGMKLILTEVADINEAGKWLLGRCSVGHTFNTQVTVRQIRNEKPVTSARSMTILEVLEHWLRQRVDLEILALRQEIADLAIKIRQADIKILGHLNIQKLAKLVRHSQNLVPDVMKLLKLTEEEAKWLLERQLQSLARLQISDLKRDQAEWKKLMAVKQKMLKKPVEVVKQDVLALEKALLKARP
jgi:DNA gyrase/topoisomerase IV subunit A